MESEITLTSIFILVLVVTATAKSALDELSDAVSYTHLTLPTIYSV